MAAVKLKFYTDKHIPKAVARQLMQKGVDVVRCEDVGLGDAPDIVHLEYATREGRVVITYDTDFIRLDSKWQSQAKRHSGIMFCLPHIQGSDGISAIIRMAMLYHELIEGGAGSIEADVANRIIYVR